MNTDNTDQKELKQKQKQQKQQNNKNNKKQKQQQQQPQQQQKHNQKWLIKSRNEVQIQGEMCMSEEVRGVNKRTSCFDTFHVVAYTM